MMSDQYKAPQHPTFNFEPPTVHFWHVIFINYNELFPV